MADVQNQSSELIPLSVVKQMMEVQEKSFRSLVKIMHLSLEPPPHPGETCSIGGDFIGFRDFKLPLGVGT